ncbi:hypothetical protein [Actinoplanes siamensis]|uniref:Uncharacterized protein n=1 Tax=Actinoplanes siamensis TaxID=1223317 RepID=A0A919NCU6_9ACTN|nr:hypothetical protein [Actinoplanes siamensis]GIF08877.1 hypothetical protein Asi03nite_64150 [Actinoplanes siamensis]
MSIEIVPATGSPWRDIYPVPKDVALQNGPWCPMDLKAGLIPQDQGWVCASCGACWDQHGRHGRWLQASTVLIVDGHLVEQKEPDAEAERLRWLDRRLATAVGVGAVCGAGYSAGRLMRPYADQVPGDLLLLLSGLLAAAGGVVVAVVLLLRWLDARRWAEMLDPAEVPEACDGD